MAYQESDVSTPALAAMPGSDEDAISLAVDAAARDIRGAALDCRHCGVANPAGRRFCGHCGKNLCEVCVQCGAIGTGGEQFCGSCGADMWAMVREWTEQIESQMSEAARLRMACRFDEALSLLGTMAKPDNPALAKRAAETRKMIDEVARERDERLALAEKSFAVARRHFEQHDYESAADVLGRIPEPLRNESMQRLFREANQAGNELTALDAELQRAIQTKKQTSGLLATVERLLTIRPDHVQAEQVAQLLGQRFCDRAEERLKRFEYDEALALLRRVPHSARTPRVEQLDESMAELAWLARDLQKAPAVSPSLLQVARRLQELAPADPRPSKVIEELQRRVRIVGSEVRRTALPWAAAPENTHLGLPIHWLTGFQRLVVGENTDRSPLIEMPGRFAVACGLALQAAGQGAMKTSLMPTDHGTMFSRMSRIIRKRPARTAWGLDLGAKGLKAVRLTADGHRRQVVFEKCAFIEHRKALSQAANKIEERQIVDETLDAFLAEHPLQGERVAAGVSGRIVLNRQLQLPPAEAKTLAKAVDYEVSHQIPHPPSQLVWDHQLLDEMHGGRPADDHRAAILVAAKREAIENQLTHFERANLVVDLVQVDTLALYNFFAFEFFDITTESESPPDAERVTALLDVGHDSSNLVIAGPQLLWFRNFGLGGHGFTRSLVQQLHVTSTRAEEIKRDPFSAESVSRVYAVFDPIMEELAGEIRRSIESFANSYPDRRVERLLASGGGCQLHGLLRYLLLGR